MILDIWCILHWHQCLMFDSRKRNSSKTNGKGQNNCFSKGNIRYYLTENLVLLLFKIYKISLLKQLFKKLDLSFLTVTIDGNFFPNLLLLEVRKIYIFFISLFSLLVSCATYCCCYYSNDFFLFGKIHRL